METTRILGISSTTDQRDNSRSEELLCKLLTYARDFGGETKLLKLREKSILPCEGCFNFRSEACTFPCIHAGQDNTQEALEAIIWSDAIAIATPVHWGGPSPLLSLLLGKMCSLENRQQIKKERGREPLLGKPFCLVASQAVDGAALALSQIEWALNQLGMFCVPFGKIFEPRLLKRWFIRAGLKVMGENKFEWIEYGLRLAARNLVNLSCSLKGYVWDDYVLIDPEG
ncbi:MAG: NAD(P)H-dependent oxidoreductase [Patescibacteria group bacterium]